MRPLRLPAGVIALGLVSLLTDLSSEMIAPLLPAFLLSLGAGPSFLGLIEGIADATAALVKLASGRWADRVPRRKPLVLAGYGLASLVRPLVGLAIAPWQVLSIRFVDRIGKGLRSTPRDALIADLAPPGRRGAAFGFHRAMDHAGALIGPLCAYALGRFLGMPDRTIFFLAAIPAGLAMLSLAIGVKEEPRAETAAPPSNDGAADVAPVDARLPRRLRRYLVLVGIFTLANSSDAFLILRAEGLGVPPVAAPLLWAVLHASRSLLSAPLGAISDRLPRTRVIIAGWLLYAAVYACFGLATEAWQMWILFLVYGAHAALVEGAEKALVADLAPDAVRGRAFGAFNATVGLLALPASLGFGLLSETAGATAFFAAAILSAVAAIGLILRSPELSPAA